MRVRCQQHSLCDYRLEVKTGDAPGAATDCNVIVQLYGERATLEPLRLRAQDLLQPAGGGPAGGIKAVREQQAGGEAMFQAGQLDVFMLRGLPDAGAFRQLVIGHDGRGVRRSWQLDWVRVIHTATGRGRGQGQAGLVVGCNMCMWYGGCLLPQ